MVKLTSTRAEDGAIRYEFDSPIFNQNGGGRLDLPAETKQKLIALANEKQYAYDDHTKTFKAGDMQVVQFYKNGFKILRDIEKAIAPFIVKTIYGNGTDLEGLLKDSANDLDLIREKLFTAAHYKSEVEFKKNYGLKDKITEEYGSVKSLSAYANPELKPKYDAIINAYEALLANKNLQ